ncbi:uncharacterized protein LOC117328516 [Pecten maximus]|uniref:uncharacterized protein LOC117328516 n=1 Tax=Pecten maximus TaxID=6579 RepID=UPI001458BFAA|nr:uncharacterized protein LOC117328516 [Pecten maximus]
MGPKRRNARPLPYDPELYENWTIARLQEELRSKNIAFKAGSKRMTLVKKLREATRSETRTTNPSAPPSRGAVYHNPPRQDGVTEVAVSTGDSTTNLDRLVNIVTSLSESVATLQDSYIRLENRLGNTENEARDRRQVAAAAGSSSQTAVDSLRLPVPTSPADFTLDTAYKRFEESATSQDGSLPTPGSSRRHASHSVSSSGIPFDELSEEVDLLWDSALSRSTRATYQSGLNCFLTFVLMQGISFPVNSLPPINEDLLIPFVTHCQKALLFKFDTIKLYLAGIRFNYIKSNLGDPTANTLRLTYILRAIKKTQVNTSSKRLPITHVLLSKMCTAITRHGMFEPFIDLMLVCIFKTAFYGFLRCGEFTCKSLWDKNFIRICDISILPDLSCFTLTLRSSKTDPFGQGVDVNVYENSVLTPVATMSEYCVFEPLQMLYLLLLCEMMRRLCLAVVAAVVIEHCLRYWFFMDYHKTKTIIHHRPGPCQYLGGADGGSEDLTVLDNGMTFISSGCISGTRGRILLFDFSNPSQEVRELSIVSSTLNAGQLNLHGLSVWRDSITGEITLMVINHGGSEDHVEVFTFQEDGQKLLHIDSITSPKLAFMNDLVMTSNRTFYITEYRKLSSYYRLELLLMLKNYNILYYDGSDFRSVAQELHMPNGINVSPDQRYLYVAEFGRKQLKSYRIVEDLFLDTMVDNIEVDPVTGELWLGCTPIQYQLWEWEKVGYDAPSQVLKVKTSEGKFTEAVEVYFDSGSELAASTVASVYRGKMIAGTLISQLIVCDLVYTD